MLCPLCFRIYVLIKIMLLSKLVNIMRLLSDVNGWLHLMLICICCIETDEPSGVDVEDGAYIHEVLWDTDMHLPVMRKLVNETCCKYAKCNFCTTTNPVGYINHCLLF